MTAVEVDLLFDDKIKQVSHDKDSPRLSDEKKIDSLPTSKSFAALSGDTVLDGNSPIIYYCLTFDTILPQPTTNISTNPSSRPTPEQPDLRKLTNPFEWPESRKNRTLWLGCLATLITATAAGSYAPATAQLAKEWDVSNTAVLVGITTFCTGFAVAPMVLAPFSEINGRYPVFVAAGFVFFICQICCAVTHSYIGMLVARFFVGCGSSVFSTMVGGVVSDMYQAENRNTPMALFSGGALFGTGVGPLVSGFLAQNLNWRWVFWMQSILCGCLVATIILFLGETRGSIILSKKAACLNKWYEKREEAGFVGFEMQDSSRGENTDSQRIRWKVKSDEERGSLGKMMMISVYRPFHLLVTEPVVFFFSLWVAFSWAVLYLTFGAIPLVFETSHDFSLQQANSVFVAMMIGALLSTILSAYQDRILARYLVASAKNVETPSRLRRAIDLSSPEGRLYFACIESALLPVGLFWFGWVSFPSIPWIVPAMAITCATMGIYSVYLATFNYLADAYHQYASSALAAQSFCRNILGGVFPLVAVQLFRNLTFQGAASLLGGIGTVLTIVPWVLVFHGPNIRARSKFASGLV